MKKISKIYILLTVFIFILFTYPIRATVKTKNNVIVKLTAGFTKAFGNSDEFRKTKVFNLLHYSKQQIDLIGKITPKPATLTVKIKNYNGNGFFEDIKVICTNVSYYNMKIEKAIFEFPNVKLNKKALNNSTVIFEQVQKIQLLTEVSSKNLLSIFNLIAKAKSLSRLKMKIHKGKLTLRGRTKRGWFIVGFKVIGNVYVKDKTKIYFNCTKLTLNHLPLPRNIIKVIFNKINPVFDSNKTWLNLVLNKVELKPGFVVTHADILPKPERNK